MTKQDGPHLVGVDGAAHAAPKPDAVPEDDQLWRQVVGCLDKWVEWAAPASQGCVLTPVQFLAVVLWVIGPEEPSDATAKLIVNRWARALSVAHSRGEVITLHPVCLLPLGREESPADCVLSMGHLQEFLDSMPIGFNLRKTLESWRDELAQPSGEKRTLEQVAKDRKAVKGTRWKQADKQVVADAVNETSISAVAKVLGLREFAVRNVTEGLKPTGSTGGNGRPPKYGWANQLSR
ncbi:hypothetical protein [Hydrogenophaga atypica]|uniref:Uncharacterized protein n=1 Tax=Hydrogenophaga atypica TaxID=249409 RepID=A0ABW2QHH8_9BURK